MTLSKISDLIPDRCNANRGTRRGHDAVAHSLRRLGAGRSIVVDKHGRIIGGHKTVTQAQAAGIEDLIVVQTDGSKIVAVRRTDLNLDTDIKARELALADNRTAELGLEWDPQIIAELSAEMDLSSMFSSTELRQLQVDAPDPTSEASPAEADSRTLTCPKCGFVFDPKQAL